jgi:hypothetical protein
MRSTDMTTVFLGNPIIGHPHPYGGSTFVEWLFPTGVTHTIELVFAVCVQSAFAARTMALHPDVGRGWSLGSSLQAGFIACRPV